MACNEVDVHLDDDILKSPTIKDILADRWSSYLETNEVREIELREVEKTLFCRTESRGCFVWKCSNCDSERKVFLGCNSRLCSRCGKRYTDQWAKSLEKKLLHVPHRHIVMSVPKLLWPWFKEDRSRWKLYMDAGILALNDCLTKITKQKVRVGAIIVIHPFGKDVGFQPHLHLIITEGGFNVNNRFVHKSYIHHAIMRTKWQYHLLQVLQKNGLPNSLATECYDKYKKGFYVWLHKDGKIKNKKQVGMYVGRYVRHPSIANSRIVSYENEIVTFWYRDKRQDDKIVIVKKHVDEFITGVIQHIPEKHFKMIRHYGIYSRRGVGKIRKCLKQSSIGSKILSSKFEKLKFECENCGEVMEFKGFRKPKPPDENEGEKNVKSFF